MHRQGCLRYSEQFKAEALRWLIECRESVPALATELGITTHSLYTWLKKHDKKVPAKSVIADSEIVRLKRALLRVTAERDALKKASAYFTARQN
ncbi:transposase [Pantoea sp. App145]|uniref:transposase n=1 Tax=Pantoea sp. App145 TaxID=3071567 RepID=UPI003A80D534